MSKTETALTPSSRDPFGLLRQMTAEFDRLFGDPGWPAFRWPSLRTRSVLQAAKWFPEIDVFEKDGRLVTRVDLPGMKKEDVKVEVVEGCLTISGERKVETDETLDQVYKSEREFGRFYRAVPLPDGVTVDDVKATFAEGVLEVSVPMPARREPAARQVEIKDPVKAGRTAA